MQGQYLQFNVKIFIVKPRAGRTHFFLLGQSLNYKICDFFGLGRSLESEICDFFGLGRSYRIYLAWETKFLAQSLFSVFLNFQALTLGEDISSRRRLFLNCLGRNQDCFSPYILYKVTTKTVHCGHKAEHCSHKGYPL